MALGRLKNAETPLADAIVGSPSEASNVEKLVSHYGSIAGYQRDN